MGLKEFFSKGDVKKGEPKDEKPSAAQPKYSETCALCGSAGTEKKWMGQYWHKKCMRQAKKGAKKMI